MIVLWHSIAFENIMMVDQVPFSRYYAIKLFCVKWSLFPRRVTLYYAYPYIPMSSSRKVMKVIRRLVIMMSF